jgi:hypothetical protein
MGDKEALKQRLIDRAQALSGKREVFRCLGVTELVREAMAFDVPSEPEIFEAAYGDPSGRKYWDTVLSEPKAVNSFARLLSVHGAESLQKLEYTETAILRALRDAAASGETWFIGEIAPLLAADEYEPADINGLDRVKVHPLATVAWLLNHPMREHLVPDSLARHLHPSRQETAGESPTELRRATEGIVHAAIETVYDAACADGAKPPNIRELPAAVLPLLKDKGYRASQKFIQTIGESPEFKARRRSPGATLTNERRKRPKK